MYKIIMVCCDDKQDLWYNFNATVSPALPLDVILLG